VTWTWEQPFAADRFFLDGSATRAKPIANGLATVTGTMTSEYFDQTFYSRVPVGRVRVAGRYGGGYDGDLRVAEFPTFTNTFSAIQIRGSSPQVGGPDLLDLSVPFVAKDDGVATAPWVSPPGSG
jgi:hypothetical protein